MMFLHSLSFLPYEREVSGHSVKNIVPDSLSTVSFLAVNTCFLCRLYDLSSLFYISVYLLLTCALHDPDNHDGVITHLEPDILECEVKWALGSITINKASGGDGIPVKLFQILEDDAVKVLHSICQQIGKTQPCPWTGKGQFSFQSQKKAMPKNAQTTAQLHSSHTLAK